jgi:hypothetical protein
MPCADHTTHWIFFSFVIMRMFLEGVTPFISPVHSACAALTAHLRPRTPSTAYVQTLGCGSTCVHAPWGQQEPLGNIFFKKKTILKPKLSLFGNTTAERALACSVNYVRTPCATMAEIFV